jgi:antitoxin VapB
MALNIKDPGTDALAREVAEMAGETITEAVNKSLRERKERLEKSKRKPGELAALLLEIGESLRREPPDMRLTEDEILGYDENGIPTR